MKRSSGGALLKALSFFPAMTRAARRELDETTASALTSAAFNAAWSAGEGLGPVLGVWPMQHWGFAPTMVACACCLGMVAAALLGAWLATRSTEIDSRIRARVVESE